MKGDLLPNVTDTNKSNRSINGKENNNDNDSKTKAIVKLSNVCLISP